MRIDIDSYREILDTLTRNKSRSFLTGFGVFWGVFMLVALIGGGQGLKEMLEKNFEGFAQNTVIVWSQQTSKAYKGFRKGRWWSMDYKDITRLKQRVPELDIVAPSLFAPWGKTNTAYYKDQKTTPRIQGCTPEYAKVIEPKLYYGRYINEMDMKEHRKVCVIGKRIYKELFKEGGDPCGKSIRIDSTYFVDGEAGVSISSSLTSSSSGQFVYAWPFLYRHLSDNHWRGEPTQMIRYDFRIQYMSREDRMSSHWDKQTVDLALSIEDSLVNVLREHYGSMVNTNESLTALAIAAGHYVQVLESGIEPDVDLLTPFTKWMHEAHSFFAQNPPNNDVESYN